MSHVLPCPAKLNLFLEIRGRRADGFHELGTLFQALETGDTLSAEPWDTIELTGADGITAAAADNLIVRAARLLRERYAAKIPSAAPAGIRFTLEKRLPMGAGLGGGSSDAASALRLARSLWNLGACDEELRAVGAEIGSDVPFFLGSPTAFAEGRGEVLSPAPSPYPYHVVVATPNCHVDTAEAYRLLAQSLGGIYGDRWPGFRGRFEREAQNPELYAELFNDFEGPVLDRFPEIREVKDRLQAFGPDKALLTGSGASVFALFRDETRAREAVADVADLCRFSVLTRFI